MYPENLAEYHPTESERVIYEALRSQLPDTFEVFYSVQWSVWNNGTLQKSEADFIVTSPDYGYLCLEVKGGTGIRIKDNVWYVSDYQHGERKLKESPYDQAEKSMYYFKTRYSEVYNANYSGIFSAGVAFPFYSINENLSNRNRESTIDCNDLNNLYPKIKKIFREWAGKSYGHRYYQKEQHRAFVELIRKNIAVAAAAGSLVELKERQLAVINRVQDNYIYFLNNIRQFYILGGAGTGKTWIAMKMAKEESASHPNQVLCVCASPTLAKMAKTYIKSSVDVLDIRTLFSQISADISQYEQPFYQGISSGLLPNCKKYAAIFVDEAQDFTEEWAIVIRSLLQDPVESRLGVFYDDVQVLREDSFGDGFAISTPPFLLRENIRNTQNIYSWAAETTNLGADVIANPVEGPTPSTEILDNCYQLTYRLETLLKEYLEDEHLPNSSLVILVENVDSFLSLYPKGIAKWLFVREFRGFKKEVLVSSVEAFKGLESNMVIYIHSEATLQNVNYIAYTRAKYYLIELIMKGEECQR